MKSVIRLDSCQQVPNGIKSTKPWLHKLIKPWWQSFFVKAFVAKI